MEFKHDANFVHMNVRQLKDDEETVEVDCSLTAFFTPELMDLLSPGIEHLWEDRVFALPACASLRFNRDMTRDVTVSSDRGRGREFVSARLRKFTAAPKGHGAEVRFMLTVLAENNIEWLSGHLGTTVTLKVVDRQQDLFNDESARAEGGEAQPEEAGRLPV